MTEKLYAERDAMEMDIAGNHYCRHVSAMTSEGLHSKADIAAELGYRDMQIAALQEQVHSTHDDYNKQLCALLPDARYMDPPDGGGVTPMEQVTRMVIDLQEQAQQLAAENCIQDFIISVVRDLARETDGVSGWHLNGDIATWDEVLPELSHSETPDTDAVIREIGAKAVDEVVKFLGGLTSDECGDSAYIGTVNIAAKLRSGEKQ